MLTNLIRIDQVMLVTGTGPGVEVGLVWDPAYCDHGPDVKCSGPGGCRVLKDAADQWNSTCERRASQLHQAAAARCRRQTGRWPKIAAKTWEPQLRGIAHFHLVLDVSTPIDRHNAELYVGHLRELAPRYLFGYVKATMTAAEDAGGASAAMYCAKYVSKSISEQAVQVRRPAYVGRHLTGPSGVTMRSMRWKRFFHKAWGWSLTHQETGGMMHLLRAFPKLEPVDSLAAAARAP